MRQARKKVMLRAARCGYAHATAEPRTWRMAAVFRARAQARARVLTLIPVRIPYVRPRHHDDERMQRAQHFDRGALRVEHVSQTSVELGTLIEAAAAEHHALLPAPSLHHLGSDTSLADHPARTSVAAASGGGTAHDASRAVHGREERLLLECEQLVGFIRGNCTADDHGIIR